MKISYIVTGLVSLVGVHALSHAESVPAGAPISRPPLFEQRTGESPAPLGAIFLGDTSSAPSFISSTFGPPSGNQGLQGTPFGAASQVTGSTEAIQFEQSATGSASTWGPWDSSQTSVRPATPAIPPGMYVQVLDGMVIVNNPSGSSGFSAGQFGFTPSLPMPPIAVPHNPGISFSTPPFFTTPPPVSTPPVENPPNPPMPPV